jgi:hypothetical protein
MQKSNTYEIILSPVFEKLYLYNLDKMNDT